MFDDFVVSAGFFSLLGVFSGVHSMDSTFYESGGDGAFGFRHISFYCSVVEFAEIRPLLL